MVEAAFTIIGIIIGFILTAVWDSLKSRHQAEEVRKNVRLMLRMEIEHNVRLLDNWLRTHPDDTGFTSPDNTLDPIDGLSSITWHGQVANLPASLEASEIQDAFSFYSNVASFLSTDRLYRTPSTSVDPLTLHGKAFSMRRYASAALARYPRL